MVERLDGKIMGLENRRDLKQAIYGPDADLGKDDLMKSVDQGAIFARNMIKTFPSMCNFQRSSINWMSYNR
jgi:hypothetical protein